MRIAPAITLSSEERTVLESQARSRLQGLSLSSGELENGTTSSGEGRVSCWGVVPACGVHRDQLGDTEPGSRAVLQQTGHGGAMDQGR